MKAKEWAGFVMILLGVVLFREIPSYWHIILWFPIWIGVDLYGGRKR